MSLYIFGCICICSRLGRQPRARLARGTRGGSCDPLLLLLVAQIGVRGAFAEEFDQRVDVAAPPAPFQLEHGIRFQELFSGSHAAPAEMVAPSAALVAATGI